MSQRRIELNEEESDEEEARGRKRGSHKRERIALKEDRRKARRLRESGKSVAVGGEAEKR